MTDCLHFLETRPVISHSVPWPSAGPLRAQPQRRRQCFKRWLRFCWVDTALQSGIYCQDLISSYSALGVLIVSHLGKHRQESSTFSPLRNCLVIATASLGLKRSLPLTRLPPYSTTADTSYTRIKGNNLLLLRYQEAHFIKHNLVTLLIKMN